MPADKIAVIYSGTDTERFHPGVDRLRVRRELGLGPEHYLVTQVGLRSQKGNDDTLDAMKIVAAKAPQARLLFVGRQRGQGRHLPREGGGRGALRPDAHPPLP